MMEGQARWSGLVMGFDNHMIAGNRACTTFSSAHSPDHHQPDKPALCRGPATSSFVTDHSSHRTCSYRKVTNTWPTSVADTTPCRGSVLSANPVRRACP
jgi:hypothetical protein